MAAAAVSTRALMQNVGSENFVSEFLRVPGKDELLKPMRISESERATVGHDEWSELVDIPVIDLSLLQTDRAGVVKQVRKAVTEWGFFQILNHGLQLEVLKEVHAQGLKFFELPSEIKERAHLPDEGFSPYTGDCSKQPASSLYWAESLLISAEIVAEKIVGRVWPDGNLGFSDAVTRYSSGSQVIGKQLLELIAESLGLSTEFFTQHFDEKKFQPLRWNYYPVCPMPTDSLGAKSHTDPNLLTVLLQDKVGGLQMEKDGQWIGIKPIEGALVINIGDLLHVWTNGICKSGLHRAVVNRESPRLSLISLLGVDGHLPISPPDELIDESHPRRFKTLTFLEYFTDVVRSRHEDGNTARDGSVVLREKFKFED